jgi:putative OPT family oligopeptide transporter
MTIFSDGSEPTRVELTIRGVILGILITFVFTAANVYLGLKTGTTIASSIPAAVISMAVLRAFKGSTIWENNIVQTVASAAGTLSSIIFVLPGLILVGWWTGFPFWMSFGICVVGGVLGVMYTIPLRRALVTSSSLPYPEGVAAAEVLKVGAGSRLDKAETGGEAGLLTIMVGALVSALVAALVAAKLFAGEIGAYFRPTPTTATGIGGTLSLALLGAGHLMGIAVGAAFAVGTLITWGIATPILAALHPALGPAKDVAQGIWTTKVKFIGAGAIAVAALWTLGRLAAPVWGGVMSAIHASIKSSQGEYEDLPRTERDLPIWIVGVICIISIMPMSGLLQSFIAGTPLAPLTLQLTIGSILYITLAGFLVAAVCGYMAGLIGSSNSPVSGLAILAVVGAALLLTLLARRAVGKGGESALVAFALLVTSILITVATIANDNLQDLKTGQLVDATPWRQQVALLIGVVAGAIVIPPVLDLLNHAFGFAGAPHNHAIANTPLPAPQANLISALAKGVIEGQLDWGLIGIGALVGGAIIGADELLRLTGRYSLPPLGVGIAIYLPSEVTIPIIIGAVAGWVYDKWVSRPSNPYGEAARRMGILMASGLIVGESLFNVALAGLIVASNKGEPLALVGDGFAHTGVILGMVGSVVVVAGLYVFSARIARRGGPATVDAAPPTG